uniref:Rad60/SUMO-like domain-containing protein n=1 Tax=Chromera velia CCMP2878 TaxID=1169474 RepID=A0A0G4HYS2_9ALVE|eukprot:Cvel_9546.t1-p1 / transcript=Cvel_9546.t1 / gene=Cvel_9546 / organism=Chromera_velia_CCMP2878 / gene_product=Small ubiquitin-related modifier 2, putative / transcript_product=Small ubiquitin-related modifier 2, putative / location=Cvel_scaffold553:24724-25620(+) / protein_length=205 / sequence_SO=supercontig / SO=protein_coding / is_pseudo=false
MRCPRPRHSRRLPLQPTRGKHELLKDLCSCINEHFDKSLFSDVLDRWASTESERTDMIDCYIRCLAFKALMNDTMVESLSMPAQIDALWHEHQQQQGAGEEGGDADPPPSPVWGGAPNPERNWKDGLHLNLRVRATDGQEIHFRIKETTRLEKLMNAYCQRLGQNIDAVCFMFDGEAVAKEQTCREIVGLGDWGLLDAMLPQTGC